MKPLGNLESTRGRSFNEFYRMRKIRKYRETQSPEYADQFWACVTGTDQSTAQDSSIIKALMNIRCNICGENLNVARTRGYEAAIV